MQKVNPETERRFMGLVQDASRTALHSEIHVDNLQTEPFKNFNDDDLEFFNERKYKTVYNLHNKVIADPSVQQGIEVLKQDKHIDMRKQRHKKKANDYIGGLAQSKMIYDLIKRQQETDQRLARLELVQMEHQDKIEQLGDAMLVYEDKFDALLALGIEEKKVQVYKLSLEKPEMTRQELATFFGKSKPTVIKWLKEIKAELLKK